MKLSYERRPHPDFFWHSKILKVLWVWRFRFYYGKGDDYA